jgi:M6 family metalloprotease-like protein
MKKLLLSLLLIFALIAPINASAAVKTGAKCKKAGQTSTYAGKKFTCVKSGKKLVWNKGVAIAKPRPVALPTPTPTPTLPSDLSTRSEITPTATLSDVAICRTPDLTTRSSGSNGFPRPQGSLYGKVNPKILFIPLSFSDTPEFSETDLARMESVLNEVKEFYKETSYGFVNLNFEILEKSKWLSIEKSAESYGLTNPRPQQNNTEALTEILTKVDSSVNFDLYDGVIIETARYSGRGVGQAFLGQKFPTQNGTAKGVSLETANAAGSFQTLAHELGHTLFGLEDLYVFLNDQRPSVPGGANPAGSWDMMSNSSKEFFGWSKFLSGWLESNQVRCITNQSPTSHYLESLESLGQAPKLVLINLQVGVSIGVEVRQRSYMPRGVLVYKVDSRINHGDGPITAQTELISEGKSLDIDGWRISALLEGANGMLVRVEKVG